MLKSLTTLDPRKSSNVLKKILNLILNLKWVDLRKNNQAIEEGWNRAHKIEQIGCSLFV